MVRVGVVFGNFSLFSLPYFSLLRATSKNIKNRTEKKEGVILIYSISNFGFIESRI